MELGIQIKQRQKALNLTQADLAQQLNVSRSAVSNWEIGRNHPDIQLIVQISDELEISLDKLLKGDNLIVKQISDDTKLRKALSKKVKILYSTIVILFILITIFIYKTNKYSDISNPSQIKTLTFKNQTIHVKTDLPTYRSLEAYIMNISQDQNSLELVLSTKLDLSMKNNNEINIPFDNSKISKIKKIDIIYEENVIKSFYLDE